MSFVWAKTSKAERYLAIRPLSYAVICTFIFSKDEPILCLYTLPQIVDEFEDVDHFAMEAYEDVATHTVGRI